jgi:hypothetical protein
MFTGQSSSEKPATNAATLSDSASLVASEATCCGSTACSCTISWTGWPLIPPLSLTQSKNALAVSDPSVKSTPGIFVVIDPSLIGVPVAFSPVPSPHLVSDGVVSPASLTAPPPPPLPELPSSSPQAAMTSASVARMASMRVGFDEIPHRSSPCIIGSVGPTQRRNADVGASWVLPSSLAMSPTG